MKPNPFFPALLPIAALVLLIAACQTVTQSKPTTASDPVCDAANQSEQSQYEADETSARRKLSRVGNQKPINQSNQWQQ